MGGILIEFTGPIEVRGRGLEGDMGTVEVNGGEAIPCDIIGTIGMVWQR